MTRHDFSEAAEQTDGTPPARPCPRASATAAAAPRLGMGLAPHGPALATSRSVRTTAMGLSRAQAHAEAVRLCALTLPRAALRRSSQEHHLAATMSMPPQFTEGYFILIYIFGKQEFSLRKRCYFSSKFPNSNPLPSPGKPFSAPSSVQQPKLPHRCSSVLCCPRYRSRCSAARGAARTFAVRVRKQDMGSL